ncbi:hypothetical protein PU630_14830 [Microbacterium horticulturae]|uniref:Pyridine nucleotide-disulphide oxidoreductase n=1 Tax=Microbacterium horticulturae TaxID=3028316 RepID=A0ABY8BWC4_9MICO|nr:hypothetical protein [Microbacterium sp. KACC 23027]WEG08501.1 hypothetical protein PU630_14830 [Microbacterium sp. KACC 23027]
MTGASGLVVGAGAAGAVAALALARAGLDVIFAVGGDDAVLDIQVALRALGEEDAETDAFADRLRLWGVEVRPDTELVGSVVIDRHIEVELSDGRVENHDLVVVVAPGVDAAPWQILASDSAPHPDAVDQAIAALGMLAG